ncbi:MAG: hypothetical protein JO183_08680 [Ktedonobacteraceae bacterium]|nr:hypothetical protein [Ktedonobacteraceae bacterium]
MKSYVTAITTSLVLVSSFLIGGIASAHATFSHAQLHYYGANLQDVVRATGVHLDGNVDPNGPWPQFTPNYCFVAVVQAVVNYDDILQGLPLRYPHQSDQGPASGNPNDEQVGQILWDMDHRMIPPGGPLAAKGSGLSRRPFTLGNIAYDFGGDPRIQAFASNDEAPTGEMKYHEHIYHTTAAAATWDMAKALARYSRPVLVLANHAEHTVLVAGFWATANPLTEPDAQIRSLAVFNPWNSALWRQYITTGSYQQVSLDDWLNATDLPRHTTLLNLPYASNGGLDPDPSIGIYQTGPGTKNPNQTHWIGNFVIIEPDTHPQSANFAFDENNRLMLQP